MIDGPEFTGRALDAVAYQHGITLAFIQPGTPSQNAHVESFNGKFRDAERALVSQHGARWQTIEQWRNDYNAVRPHTARGGQAPAEFARALTNNGESHTAVSLNWKWESDGGQVKQHRRRRGH